MKSKRLTALTLIACVLLGITGCSRTVEDVAKWKSSNDIVKLKEALGDPKEEVRLAAANALGELKSEEAVDDLAARFNDEEESVQLAAIDALISIGGDSIVTPLVAALTLPSSEARIKAAEALGNQKVVSAVDPLHKAMSDPEEPVRMAAVKAIGKIGTAKGNADSALKVLMETLASEDTAMHDAAMQELMRVGSPAIPQMMQGLRSESSRVRSDAITLLRGLSAIPKTGEDFIWYQLAKDSLKEDGEIDGEAVGLLAEQGEAAIDPLLEAASSKIPSFREYANLALNRIGTTATTKALALAETKANAAAKSWVGSRTSWSGAPSDRIDLWAAATALNPDFSLDKTKAATLQAKGNGAKTLLSMSEFKSDRPYLPYMIQALDDPSCADSAQTRLTEAGERVLPLLLAAVESENEEVANRTASILAKRSAPEALNPLMNALQKRIDEGQILSTSNIYDALQQQDSHEAEPLLQKVRPNGERAIRVFSRQYRTVKVVGAETTDTFTSNEDPITFRIGYIDGAEAASMNVTFKKDVNGNWLPSPALPYKPKASM